MRTAPCENCPADKGGQFRLLWPNKGCQSHEGRGERSGAELKVPRTKGNKQGHLLATNQSCANINKTNI